MKNITTFLMFEKDAEEAVKFYLSVFPDTKVLGEGGSGGPGYTATFELQGHQLMAFNGGPHFKFAEGMSLFVNCETQAEVDELWDKLTAGGGEPGNCGWLTDKFGISWQIIPTALSQYLSDPDPIKAKRALDAMLKMHKIEIEGLKKAYEGK
jgi:predicted 3-demethylubiquinone-9 3-methyltransferase (glyoxalase superfamily)